MIVGNQYITDGTRSHNVLWIKIKIIKKNHYLLIKYWLHESMLLLLSILFNDKEDCAASYCLVGVPAFNISNHQCLFYHWPVYIHGYINIISI